MRRGLILAVCLAVSSLCLSQDSLTVEPRGSLARHTIKFSPFHLLSFYPTIQVAYEIRIAPQWTLQFDGGVVFNAGVPNDDFREKRGFKIKFEPRYYYAASRSGKIAWYITPEFYMNDVDFKRTSDEVECFDPDCLNRFTRRYTYRMNYKEHGVAFKPGMVIYFRNFLFDLSGGFAIRFIDYSAPPFVDFEEDVLNWYDIPRVQDRVGFAPVLNFRLGYRIP